MIDPTKKLILGAPVVLFLNRRVIDESPLFTRLNRLKIVKNHMTSLWPVFRDTLPFGIVNDAVRLLRIFDQTPRKRRLATTRRADQDGAVISSEFDGAPFSEAVGIGDGFII